MGYTHYMRLNRTGLQDKWAEAVMAAKQIIDASPVPLGDGHGEGDGPAVTDKGIYVNGVGEDSHETLFVPTVLAQLEEQPRGEVFGHGEYFECCKTAEKPYDIVVTAVYATLAQLAGPACVKVTSDGDPEDWDAGCELASRVLGQLIEVPIQ